MSRLISTAGVTTTGLTSSTTLANHLAGIQTAALTKDGAGNSQRVEQLLAALQKVADLCVALHL